MKIVYVFSSILILAACATSAPTRTSGSSQSTKSTLQEAPGENKPIMETEETLKVDYIPMQGTVHLAKNGCDQLIEVKSGSSSLLLYPINLGKEFRKEGKEVTFTFDKVNVPFPEGCEAQQSIRIVSMNE